MQNPLDSSSIIHKFKNPILIIYADGDKSINNQLTENLISFCEKNKVLKINNENHNSILFNEQLIHSIQNFLL